MRIGEVSRGTGLPRDTIRYYEREGLIGSDDPPQTSNSYRDYSEATVERLIMITEARSVGFSVEDLRRLFAGLDGMVATPFDAEGFLDGKIEELRALIERSRRLIQMLRATKAALAGPN